MTYSVKEIFYTLQGEGARAGTAAVFCRFAGCNLWSGDEATRSRSQCRFCDTDFVGTQGTLGGKYTSPDDLAQCILSQWPQASSPSLRETPWVVLTGGEPLLQVDRALLNALHRCGFKVAVETNGSLAAPKGIDWLCVSPKAHAPWVQRSGDELKLVWPQPGWTLKDLDWLETQGQFTHRLLQPLDATDQANPDIYDEHNKGAPIYMNHTQLCVQRCLTRPAWRLSLQTHKHLGLR
jgi:7-carboxy-7-deazaguanine synthase